jgi:hypothetical protein
MECRDRRSNLRSKCRILRRRLPGRAANWRHPRVLQSYKSWHQTCPTTQLSFFNEAYNQHMYHPLLIFERHTGCLLAARLRRGTASSHARIVPLLLRVLRRLLREFPGVTIRLRADAGFALPLLYKFCEFFGIHYTIGIPANVVFRRRTAALQRRLARRYRRTHLPQRSFTSFRHRARTWPRLRRIVAKAEHSTTGTNLRFLVTNCPGRSAQVFRFYNERGECENRIEEFKNGFHADRLSCHRFLANAFRLLLHLCLQLGQPVPPPPASGLTFCPDRNPAHPAVQNRSSGSANRSLCAHPPGQWLALPVSVSNRGPTRRHQLLNSAMSSRRRRNIWHLSGHSH